MISKDHNATRLYFCCSSLSKEHASKSKMREENSEKILSFIKEKLSNETVEKKKSKKKQKMVGMSWVQWRLMEYRRKIAEEKVKENDETKNTKSIVISQSNESKERLEIEGNNV